jgi:nicotinamidase/pyrazinamidase
MTYPRFYQPERVGKIYPPDTQAAIDAGKVAGVIPASEDSHRTLLMLVDTQIDFVHEDGALSVPGAVEDTRRTVEWIYNHCDKITAIAASLDSHVPLQIFFPTWWANSAGQHPQPFTPISSSEVRSGKWRPLYEIEWSRNYVEKLETQARKALMIWPYHTLIGTVGHAIVPALYEAIAYHTAARRAQPNFLNKGTIPKTEHYSILEPEVKVEGEPAGQLNEAFLKMIATYDTIYVAGQAKSHCVLETVTSMMRYFSNQQEIIRKFRLLMDCTSSVAHPEIDFDAIANEQLAKYKSKGLNLVTTADEVVAVR